MSDGYPTAAQKGALRAICAHEPASAGLLADKLLAARQASGNVRHSRAITRMAGTLAWRLQAQGFIAETSS